MAISAAGLGSLGGAVSDIFGGASQFAIAKGYKTAAGAYLGAADIYKQQAGVYGEQAGVYGQMGVQSGVNAGIAAGGARLQQIQAEREIYRTIGGQRSDVASAGLEASGSALDILRDSTSQGHLKMSVLRSQGQLEQAGYKEEQLSYQAMGKASEAAAAGSLAQASNAVGQAGVATSQASAAKTSGAGGILGGILKGVGAVAGILAFSDYRLKDDIIFLRRREDGLGVYSFRYRGREQRYVGVIAQEVAQLYPEAVHLDDLSGFLYVDYGAIKADFYAYGTS